MKCPSCSNRLQQVRTKVGAAVDICPECRGIWFDYGKFADFVNELARNEKISPQETKFFQHRDVHSVYELKEKDNFCPKCSQKLTKFNYSCDSNVFLDKCPNCSGIWADGGEIEQVARYIKEDPKATEIGRALAHAIGRPEVAVGEAAKAAAPFFLFFPKVIVPLGNDAPKKRFPVVTISIIILCALFFIYRLISDPISTIAILELIPERDFRGIDLLTSMFLIGTLLHLVWDIIFLWVFGNSVEYQFSRSAYLAFFVFCGVLSSLLYSVFNWNLSIITVSISGSVAGVIGAYFIFYPMAKIKLFVFYRTFEIPTVVCVGVWFSFHLVGPFLPIGGDVPKTAWLAAILGFLTGAVVAFAKKNTSESRQ